MMKCPLDNFICNRIGCNTMHKCPEMLPNPPATGHPPIAGVVGMTMLEFQQDAISTKVHEGEKLFYSALGLDGEAGEYADKVKKLYRGDPQVLKNELGNRDAFVTKDGKSMSQTYRRSMALELGDVLWYLVSAADDLGYSLEEIAQMNIGKRRDRKLKGTLRGEGDNR